MEIRIVMTVSDRPEYLAATLGYWAAVRDVRNYLMTFYVEPSPEYERNMTIIRKYKYDTNAWISVVSNKVRHGVQLNPWTAYRSAFLDSADFVILCEEDTPVSSDILEYFEWAAAKFKEDEDVLGVCARSDPSVEHLSETGCVLASDFSPVVWGMWERSWHGTFQGTWDKDYSTGSGDNRGYDHNIRLRVMGDRKFVFPLASRSTHIGRSGAHMHPSIFESSIALSFKSDREPDSFELVDYVPPIIRQDR